jgi:hypothetical protein
VLAGAVAGQRPDQGDLVDAAGPLHVDQGGVAAVSQVLAGEQAPALQPGVDPGQGLPVVAGGGLVAMSVMTLARLRRRSR